MSYLQSGEKLYIKKETTPSAAVTGTLTETQVYALEIPPNSFSAGDKFVLDSLLVSKTGTAGTTTIRIKLSTSSTMDMGTTNRIGESIAVATNRSIGMQRVYNIESGNISGYSFGAPSFSIYSGNNAVAQSKPFDPTVTNYLYISVILGDVADSVTVHGYTLKNF
jgi:hypothetical protein